MINSFGRKTTPRRLCMSVDLRKTFDTVAKAFDTTLEGFDFSEELAKILDQCYKTNSFSAFVDEEPLTKFTSQREFQQNKRIP